MNKDFKIKKSIQQKLVKRIAVLLLITVVLSLTFSEITMIILRKKNENLLVDRAIESSTVFTEGQSEKISEQISGIVSNVRLASQYAENIYKNPDYFSPHPIMTPKEFPSDTTGNTFHWIPYFKDEINNLEIVGEAEKLTALEPVFEAIMRDCPMIVSLYVATNTHINIGYDQNVLLKLVDEYNPEESGALWYTAVMDTHEQFISDTYTDSFGRGLTVTISEPYYVDGEIRGVIGADIIIENIANNILNIDTGTKDGYAMLFSDEGYPICAKGMNENTTSIQLLGNEKNVREIAENQNGIIKTTLKGKEVYIIYDTIEYTDWTFAVVLDVDSIIAPAKESSRYIMKTILLLLAINAVIFTVMIFYAKKDAYSLSAPIIQLTNDVKKIGDGQLDYSSSIKTADEIELLSRSFEDMTVSLKQYIENLTSITKEKERIGAELDVAAHIQSSMLPCIFPAFPDSNEFDIYATMNPAKEVGGDFYDFFMVDNTHIAIVMADVSGKGIPAALFMVIGKTLIKDHTRCDCDLGEVFTTVNNLLCESNSEGLFITAFEGVLDIVTGEFKFVNAGHEMPYISKKGSPFEPYKIKPGFVLAGMEDIQYKAGSMMLEPGDKIFQYTDGITEATNENNELYGMDRLTNVLAECSKKPPSEILPYVKQDIDKFVKDAQQFDDITMLCLEYKSKKNIQ